MSTTSLAGVGGRYGIHPRNGSLFTVHPKRREVIYLRKMFESRSKTGELGQSSLADCELLTKSADLHLAHWFYSTITPSQPPGRSGPSQATAMAREPAYRCPGSNGSVAQGRKIGSAVEHDDSDGDEAEEEEEDDDDDDDNDDEYMPREKH